MLQPADLGLVRRDPAVPGLGFVFDVDALLELMEPRLPANGQRPTGGRITYLRYKPGTSIVAGYLLETAAGPLSAYVKAWSPVAVGKLDKVARYGRGDPFGWGAVVDEPHLVALVADTSDRALPAVRDVRRHPERFLPPGLADHPVRTLRYNPERRWVGVAGAQHRPAVLVKVHPPGSVAPVLRASRALAGAGLPVPGIVSTRVRRGVVASAWVEGATLHSGPVSPQQLAATGSLLARMHAVPPFRDVAGPDLLAELATAVAAVASVLPESAESAASVARRAAAALAALPLQRCVVHGDLSRDQVVAGPHGVSLIDLDRVRVDDPVVDLASWVAADVAAGRAQAGADPAALLGPLLSAYEDESDARVHDRLPALTSAALLKRAAEPFRFHQPDWPDRVRDLVDAASTLLRVTT
jgi:aminoglycoside phosphotransferase (APT) family kinase protein